MTLKRKDFPIFWRIVCENSGGERRTAMLKTGFVFHQDYLKHLTGEGHPESPGRLKSLIDYLERKKLLQKLEMIRPQNPSVEWVKKIHSEEYIELMESCCRNRLVMLDADTVVCPDSYKVALLAVGGVLSAVDEVAEKKVKNAFCAIRPPGHHAENKRAMGFCVFNNVAIGARYVQEKHKFKKILIVDWDAHHGNGTQKIFYEDPSVFYFSIHEYPFYPGTGAERDKGEKEGEGFTFNIPMCVGSGDSEYIEVFENIFYPVAVKFAPDFIFISAGFDGHQDDPLTNLNLTADGFKRITEVVCDLADECCEGRLVSVLEGGYSLRALSESVSTHLSVLMKYKLKGKKQVETGQG